MKCPFCNGSNTQVIDTRENESNNSIRRRRRCPECDKRFTTFETVELRMPQVIKHSGARSEFNQDKLRISLNRALHKRPVPADQVEQALNQIQQQILSAGEREIASQRIGKMVMEQLLQLDKVAYIRFASVYKSFQDVGDFTKAIKAVKN